MPLLVEIKTSIKYDKLKKLAKALSKSATVKVGLLANKPGENGGKGSDFISENLDLAGLGALQEFGCQIPVTDKMRGFFRHHFGINIKSSTTYINIPARAFLGTLFSNPKTTERLMSAGNITGDTAFDVEYFKYKLLDNPNFVEDICIALGAKAVEIIQEAFSTGGFGEWQANSSLTIKNKGSAQPLVDTGRLSGAITYEVESNG